MRWGTGKILFVFKSITQHIGSLINLHRFRISIIQIELVNGCFFLVFSHFVRLKLSNFALHRVSSWLRLDTQHNKYARRGEGSYGYVVWAVPYSLPHPPFNLINLWLSHSIYALWGGVVVNSSGVSVCLCGEYSRELWSFDWTIFSRLLGESDCAELFIFRRFYNIWIGASHSV